MKKGLNNKILERMLDLHSKSIKRIKDSLGGTQPFAKKQIPPEDLIYAKNNIGYVDLEELTKEFGIDMVGKLMYDITLSEQRRELKGENYGRTYKRRTGEGKLL